MQKHANLRFKADQVTVILAGHEILVDGVQIFVADICVGFSRIKPLNGDVIARLQFFNRFGTVHYGDQSGIRVHKDGIPLGRVGQLI